MSWTPYALTALTIFTLTYQHYLIVNILHEDTRLSIAVAQGWMSAILVGGFIMLLLITIMSLIEAYNQIRRVRENDTSIKEDE